MKYTLSNAILTHTTHNIPFSLEENSVGEVTLRSAEWGTFRYNDEGVLIEEMWEGENEEV